MWTMRSLRCWQRHAMSSYWLALDRRVLTLQRVLVSFSLLTQRNRTCAHNAAEEMLARRCVYEALVNMAICNTVVVNAHAHADSLNEAGHEVRRPTTMPPEKKRVSASRT